MLLLACWLVAKRRAARRALLESECHHRIEPSAEPSHRSLALARSAAHFCGFRSSESKAVRTYITYSRTRDSIPSLAFIAKKIGLEVKANNPTVAPPTQEVVKSIARSFLLLSIANFKLLAASFRTSVVSFHAPTMIFGSKALAVAVLGALVFSDEASAARMKKKGNHNNNGLRKAQRELKGKGGGEGKGEGKGKGKGPGDAFTRADADEEEAVEAIIDAVIGDDITPDAAPNCGAVSVDVSNEMYYSMTLIITAWHQYPCIVPHLLSCPLTLSYTDRI